MTDLDDAQPRAWIGCGPGAQHGPLGRKRSMPLVLALALVQNTVR
jgi:hypothetical protein